MKRLLKICVLLLIVPFLFSCNSTKVTPKEDSSNFQENTEISQNNTDITNNENSNLNNESDNLNTDNNSIVEDENSSDKNTDKITSDKKSFGKSSDKNSSENSEDKKAEKESKDENESTVIKKNMEEEFIRSAGTVEVSFKDFTNDKKDIMKIIKELNKIMENDDYASWVKYLDNESINYWSQPLNLRRVSARLPVKGIQLNTLEDYFKHVFIPSRKGYSVNEIRYKSETVVKAVQVVKDSDYVYYTFYKVGDQWKLHLPQFSE